MFRRLSTNVRLIAAAALLVASAGCGSDSPTQADALTIAASTFGGASADPAASDIASPIAGAAAGTIRVTGTIRLPAPCYDVSARVESSNGFVMLQVVGEQRSGGCAAQVTAVSYDILIAGSTAGRHPVSVRHTVEAGLVATTHDVALLDVVVK